MVQRIFGVGIAEDAALLRLGTAVVLKWSMIPGPLRDELIQQALAVGNHDPEVFRGIIDRLVQRTSE
ncbi:MAG: hypothetical protein J0H94_03765 [Rhizobiales bacterium]|nr:hypothetical protein [Hyphomicrobiales bacterium]